MMHILIDINDRVAVNIKTALILRNQRIALENAFCSLTPRNPHFVSSPQLAVGTVQFWMVYGL